MIRNADKYWSGKQFLNASDCLLVKRSVIWTQSKPHTVDSFDIQKITHNMQDQQIPFLGYLNSISVVVFKQWSKQLDSELQGNWI